MAFSLKRMWSGILVRRETISTVLMGVAALLTTWCAFESTKWMGIQTIRFNAAQAARTESTRNQLADTQLLQVDVATYVAWLQALQAELGTDLKNAEGPYHPDPDKLSGFLYRRFRPEFRSAVQAWIATRPLKDPEAPATPFAMSEYRRPLRDLAERQEAKADELAASAKDSNRISDTYMLTTVIAALVVFFAGLSTKLQLPANGLLMLAMALLALVVCCAFVAKLPVVITAS